MQESALLHTSKRNDHHAGKEKSYTRKNKSRRQIPGPDRKEFIADLDRR